MQIFIQFLGDLSSVVREKMHENLHMSEKYSIFAG